MIFIYVLFFLALNLMIFSFLTKKIEFNFRVQIGLIVLLVAITVLHLFKLLPELISNQHFFHLVLFSMVLFIMHFGSKLAILSMKKINPNFETHIVFSVFNFMRYYIIYVLVFVYQCISLFSPQ